MTKVKIVCTIGPACSSYKTLLAMASAGMNVARLNFSHGDYEDHLRMLGHVRGVEKELNIPIPTLLDTKGPEIRTGKVEGGTIALESGSKLTLTDKEILGNISMVRVNYPKLADELSVGQEIFIDDGSLHLKVEQILNGDVLCRVIVGGLLGDAKGVNIPGAELSLPALSDKDVKDIEWGVKNQMDYIAVSFVKNSRDIMEVRRAMEGFGGAMKVIAKIETRHAVQNIEEIAEVVDGMMIARGDLGVEIQAEEVPLQQKRIIDVCRAKGKAVIVATQMLDSMIRNPRPTRAEASDVANAVLDGADAVMLSGETARGAYPLQSVETMRRIVSRTEKEIELWQRPFDMTSSTTGVPDAVSGAAVLIARQMKASAIISMTRSGSTAQMVSRYRPPCSILGATPKKRTWRELALYWGVVPLMKEEMTDQNTAVDSVVASCLENGEVKEGDLLVVTAGVPLGITGTTNLVQVYIAGKILLKGQTLLKREARGPVCTARTAEEARLKMTEGSVLVVAATDDDYLPAIRMASAIVAEQGGLSSHAAVIGLELGIPSIVGAEDALNILSDGMVVTLDGHRGLLYHGDVRLSV
ncbi:MAG: pyruvate kinase [Synergistaceae bacterium]|nr:pyruvate kinase [Synergistota bacterium]NLM70815.1 pyruvate kinase [Synergistaceae bacterium]